MRQKAVVAPSRRRRDRQLLDLPAPREPPTVGARGERPLPAHPRRSGRDREAPRVRRGIDSEGEGTRWSFHRDFGNGTRAIFIDSRAGRVLEARGDARSSIDDEWELDRRSRKRRFRPPALATTVPFLLSPGLHHLEAWSERVCDGVWGQQRREGLREAPARRRLRPLGVVRLVLRLLRDLIAEIGSGAHGEPPAVDSGCSPETSTTPTSSRSASRPTTGSAAPSFRAACSPLSQPALRTVSAP